MDKINEPKELGGRISACRQNRNMTQEELAGRLGITPQALSKWERGVSLPDVSMLAELSGLLGVSADYLLGLKPREDGEEDAGSIVRKDLLEMGIAVRNALPPVELVFGVKVVPLFIDNKFVEKIVAMREQLAAEMGILLPVVRLRDHIRLEEQEFAVLSFRNVLYSEKLEVLDENTVDYMLEKLKECVCQNYHEILAPDLIKNYTDNLKITYPALIEGVVPEKIPYSLLTETARIVLSKGDSIIFLPKMIEIMDCALRTAPQLTAEELADRIRGVIEREDEYDIVLGRREEERRAESGGQ